MEKIDAKHFYNDVMPGKQGDDYEHARWHHNRVASVGYEQTKSSIEKALPNDVSIQSILEVGPGAGTWTKVLIDKYPEAELTLLDISKEMLDRSKATLGERPATYIESPFGDFQAEQKFNLFFSSRMLEYMEDKEGFVEKIKQVLKPGASAVMVTKYPHYARQKMMGKEVRDFHTGQIHPKLLKNIFLEKGFKVKTLKAVTISVPFFKSAWLNKMAGSLVRRLPLNPVTNTCVESYLLVVELS